MHHPHQLRDLLDALGWRAPHWHAVEVVTRNETELWAEVWWAAMALDADALSVALDRVYTVRREAVLGDGMGGEGYSFPNSDLAKTKAHYAGAGAVNKARVRLRQWAREEAVRMERAADERAELRAGGEG